MSIVRGEVLEVLVDGETVQLAIIYVFSVGERE